MLKEEINLDQQRRSSKPEIGYSLADKVKQKFEKLAFTSGSKSRSRDKTITTQPSSPYPSPVVGYRHQPFHLRFRWTRRFPWKRISPISEDSDFQIIYAKKTSSKGQPAVTYVPPDHTPHTRESVPSNSPVVTTTPPLPVPTSPDCCGPTTFILLAPVIPTLSPSPP